jgi:hypothetical protein
MLQENGLHFKGDRRKECRECARPTLKQCRKDPFYRCRSSHEAQFVILYYFCRKTMREIGEEYGVTSEGVRQVLKKFVMRGHR